MADNFPNLGNPFAAALMGPDILQKQYQVQQNQRIADMLMQQSDSPLNGQMVSGHYVGASPLQGLANMLSAYSGRKMMDAIPSQQYDLANMQDAQLNNMLGMGALAGGQGNAPQQPQMTNPQGGAQAMPVGQPGQPQGMPQGPQSPPAAGGVPTAQSMGINPLLAKQLITFGGPQAYADLIKSNAGLTDLQKTALAAGLQPGTPGYSAAMQGNLAKQNYIAPVSGRPGGYLAHPDGSIQQLPHVPDGFTSVQGRDGQWNIVPVNGGTAALGASAAAVEGGKGSQLPFTEGRGPTGAPLPITNRTQAATGQIPAPNLPAPMRNNNPGALMPGGQLAQYGSPQEGIAALDNNLQSYAKQGINTVAGAISKWAPASAGNPTDAYIAQVAQTMGVKPDQPIDLSSPYVRHGLAWGIMRQENGTNSLVGAGKPQPIYAQPPMGAVTAADTGQKNLLGTLDTKYQDLSKQNAQAQTAVSRLDSIVDLAKKAAVGPLSDKVNYVNGLLAFAGSKEKADTVTANQLLEKNANQIIAALSNGGLSTDAGKALLAAAYPNTHMTEGAINDASGNLRGAQQMIQAKAKLLTPHYNAQNPQEYNTKELTFDQNADPKIWQYMGMQNPQERATFAKSVVKQDPNFLGRVKALVDLGVFQ